MRDDSAEILLQSFLWKAILAVRQLVLVLELVAANENPLKSVDICLNILISVEVLKGGGGWGWREVAVCVFFDVSKETVGHAESHALVGEPASSGDVSNESS